MGFTSSARYVIAASLSITSKTALTVKPWRPYHKQID